MDFCCKKIINLAESKFTNLSEIVSEKLKLLQYFGVKLWDYILEHTTTYNRVERYILDIPTLQLFFSRNLNVPEEPTSQSILKIKQLLKGINDFPINSLNKINNQNRLDILKYKLKTKTKFSNFMSIVNREINYIYECQRQIMEHQKTPFDTCQKEHTELITGLWNHLLDGIDAPPFDKSVKSSSSISWSLIGFQSKPQQDFRGTGILGAMNLFYFSNAYTFQAKKVYEITKAIDNPKKWVPFAITGINITYWLLTLFYEGFLDMFFVYNNKYSPLDTFNTIYVFYFCEFSNYWRRSNSDSVMNFNSVGQKFIDNSKIFFTNVFEDVSKCNSYRFKIGENLVSDLITWIKGDTSKPLYLESNVSKLLKT